MKTDNISFCTFGRLYVDKKVKNVFWSRLFLNKYGAAARTDAIPDILHIQGSPTHHIFVNADKSVEYISPETAGKPLAITKGRTLTAKFMRALNILITKS